MAYLQCWLHKAREIQVDLSDGDGGGGGDDDDEAVAFGAFDASDICYTTHYHSENLGLRLTKSCAML